jgi:ABC-type Fe3+-siderophore transport system permease subunit
VGFVGLFVPHLCRLIIGPTIVGGDVLRLLARSS